MNWRQLAKSKTFWAGVSAIVGGVALCCQGDMSAGLPMITTALVGIFLRDGQITGQNKTEKKAAIQNEGPGK